VQLPQDHDDVPLHKTGKNLTKIKKSITNCEILDGWSIEKIFLLSKKPEMKFFMYINEFPLISQESRVYKIGVKILKLICLIQLFYNCFTCFIINEFVS
jgi:hypothetical protein